MYLNTVEYGSSAFGIKVAAKTFFSTSPDSLKPEEAAMLVGVLNNPTAYNPRFHPGRPCAAATWCSTAWARPACLPTAASCGPAKPRPIVLALPRRQAHRRARIPISAAPSARL
ncbi:MAG: transglycosylase domain-containing protein [Hymenobacter sp.]